MSVMVHSVHNNIVPHIAIPRSLFGCDFRPWLTLLFPAQLPRTVLCWRVCRAQAQACLSTGGGGGADLRRRLHGRHVFIREFVRSVGLGLQ